MIIQNSKISSWLMALTAFLIPFYIFRFKIAGIPTNVFELAVLFLLVVTIIQISNIKYQSDNSKFKNLSRLSTFYFLLSTFIVSCFLSLWRAGWSSEALGMFKGWIVVPILFGAAVSYQLQAFRSENNPETISCKLKAVFWGLYTSILVVSIWAVLQKLGIIGTLFYQAGDKSFNQYLGGNFRAFGPFESPNYLPMYIVPATFLVIGTNLQIKIIRSKIWKGSFYLSLILPLLALYFSQSRAGWIALTGSLSIIAIIRLYQHLKNKFWCILLVFASIILYLLLIIIVFKYGLRGTDTIRLQIYQYSWQMLRENWLLGVGLGNFQNYLNTLSIDDSFRQYVLSYAYHPHNLYLALWLNFGILGLVSFFLVVWTFIKTTLKNPTNYWLLAAMIAILVHGLLDTTYFKNDLAVLFWLIVFLAVYKRNIGYGPGD